MNGRWATARILCDLAMRNLFSHWQKNMIVGSIMAFGTILVVFGTAILDSVEYSMSRSIISSFGGHLQVYDQDARDDLALFGGGMMGAGTMGGGIAMNFLSAGIPVTILERQKEALDRGVGIIRKNYENTAKRGRMTEDKAQQVLALITPTAENSDLNGCDLIIEAVFENMALKHEITKELEPCLAEGGVWGSNTSTLPITQLAEASADAAKAAAAEQPRGPGNVAAFIGDHVHKMIAFRADAGRKAEQIRVVQGVIDCRD